jgi:hypothetical protein
LKRPERGFLNRQPIEENDVEDDPANREKTASQDAGLF